MGSRHDDIDVGGPTGRPGPGYADQPHDCAVYYPLVERRERPVSRRREERRGEYSVYRAVLPELESVGGAIRRDPDRQDHRPELPERRPCSFRTPSTAHGED